MRRRKKTQKEGPDVRAICCSMKPAPQRLARQQTRNLHAGRGAGPVDERDGAAVRVVVHGAVGLRRVRDDPVALAAARVDDGRVQDVRAEVGDVEDGRARRGRRAPAAGRAAPRERAEYRRLLRGRVVAPVAAAARGRVPDAPALYIWIKVCGHRGVAGWWLGGRFGF
jgi:hypothetical protein